MGLQAIRDWARLPSSEKLVVNVWINDDIRPLPPSRRTWTTVTYISFWLTNQIAISNWQLGGSLVATGLSVWQAVLATLIGKIIISLVAIFNGYCGAEWHIGFPVVSRYIWGPYGAFLHIAQRCVLGLVWFSVQSWTGGLCVCVMLSALSPGFHTLPNVFSAASNLETKRFVGWVLFNVVQAPLLYIPPHRIKRVLYVFNALSATTLVCIMIWCLSAAGGAGPLLAEGAKPMSSWDLGWSVVQGVTTVIGGIAVGLTNQNDYSRFARRPGDQVLGQWLSIILFGTVLPLFGCLAASATQGIWGEAIWNPPDIALKWLDTSYTPGARAGAFFSGLGLLIIQVSINIVDNGYSMGMDLAGLLASYVNIRRGAYIGLALNLAMCPWQLLSSAAVFIAVLSAYSVFLGPVIGIQICDYWVLRRRRLRLADLYHPRPDGVYYFWRGVNPRSFAAWVLGFATQLPGFAAQVTPRAAPQVARAWRELYYLAFPLGLAVSAVAHYALNRVWPPAGLGAVDDVDLYGTFTPDEAARLGVALPPPAAASSSSADRNVVAIIEGVASCSDASATADKGDVKTFAF